MLHFDQAHPDAKNIIVRLNGKVEFDFVEVDVLGCVGRRIARRNDGNPMYDDDGFFCYETVYGRFELELKSPAPYQSPAVDADRSTSDDYPFFF